MSDSPLARGATGPEALGWPGARWVLLRYFTILTNLLTAGVTPRIARDRAPSAETLAGVTLSIAMVGAVYHALLAPEVALQGAAALADVGFHTLVPAGALLWWVVWGDKGLRLASVPRWLIWPFAHCLYALLRGAADGRYPYFVLDVGQFGAGRAALNITGLLVAFALAGLTIWTCAALLQRRASAARI
ncbi:MAG: Pr6Pr family membrane protein [Rhodobacter sp.]|nr:Pr6Pr family membrane protein [Paracoccaceae bacterium]MCC0076981.1 Pr6Pr family membrane protein [Rhodobacter sp.]